MSVGTVLLVHVFTALLPPAADDERHRNERGETVRDEYYSVLGLSTVTATPEEIRRAYKKRSLELHPDKVAQRRLPDPERAAAEYQRVQEAYTVLSDPKHRREYAACRYSPARYRFVTTGGVTNAAALYGNLSAAPCRDKTRLVALAALAVLVLLLQPVLVCAKINAEVLNAGPLLSSKWTAILSPAWTAWCLYFLLRVAFVEWNLKIFAAAEDLCWLTGAVLTAAAWDGTVTMSWNKIAIPYYLAIFWRLAFLARAAANLLEEQGRMVSQDYLEGAVLRDPATGQFAKLSDMTEEEREEVMLDHVVVTVDEDAAQEAMEEIRLRHREEQHGGQAEEHVFTAEDIESIRVRTSPEYQETDAAAAAMARASCNLAAFGFAFVALVATKLTGQIAHHSWWTVFVPVWLYLGLKIAESLFTCCCAAAGREVIVLAQQQQRDQQRDEQQHQQQQQQDGKDSSLNKVPSDESSTFRDEEAPPPTAAAATATATATESSAQQPISASIGSSHPSPSERSLQWAPVDGHMSDFMKPVDDVQQQDDDDDDDTNTNNESSFSSHEIVFDVDGSCNSSSVLMLNSNQQQQPFDEDAAALQPLHDGSESVEVSLLRRHSGGGISPGANTAAAAGSASGSPRSSAAAAGPSGPPAAAAGAAAASSLKDTTATDATLSPSLERGKRDPPEDDSFHSSVQEEEQLTQQQRHGYASADWGGEEKKTEEPAGTITSRDDDDNDESEFHDEDDEDIRIDEETFQAWQQAQEEADQSAMEARARAQSTCCWATFQLMICCLIVGKLELDYNTNNESGTTGYNAFWILFPIFFVTGVALCCCSCLVYSAGDVSGLDDWVERNNSHNGDDAGEAGDGGNNSSNKEEHGTASSSQNTTPTYGGAGGSTSKNAAAAACGSTGERVIVMPPPPPQQQQQRPSPAAAVSSPTSSSSSCSTSMSSSLSPTAAAVSPAAAAALGGGGAAATCMDEGTSYHTSHSDLIDTLQVFGSLSADGTYRPDPPAPLQSAEQPDVELGTARRRSASTGTERFARGRSDDAAASAVMNDAPLPSESEINDLD